jgi:hypothetical protein
LSGLRAFVTIFDLYRNSQLQGVAGREATTTMYGATEAVASVSGISQGAEDFTVPATTF